MRKQQIDVQHAKDVSVSSKRAEAGNERADELLHSDSQLIACSRSSHQPFSRPSCSQADHKTHVYIVYPAVNQRITTLHDRGWKRDGVEGRGLDWGPKGWGESMRQCFVVLSFVLLPLLCSTFLQSSVFDSSRWKGPLSIPVIVTVNQEGDRSVFRIKGFERRECGWKRRKDLSSRPDTFPVILIITH